MTNQAKCPECKRIVQINPACIPNANTTTLPEIRYFCRCGWWGWSHIWDKGEVGILRWHDKGG